jgi:hypothetical protein
MGLFSKKETPRPSSKTSASTLNTSVEPSEMEKTDPTADSADHKEMMDAKEAGELGVDGRKSEEGPQEEVDDYDYPSGLKLTLITLALCLSVFCMALVRSQRIDTGRRGRDFKLEASHAQVRPETLALRHASCTVFLRPVNISN